MFFHGSFFSVRVQSIEQEALKQLLKRMKNSVDKGTYNDNRQYDGENHLFGIEFLHKKIWDNPDFSTAIAVQEQGISGRFLFDVLHEKSGLIFFIQPKCGMQNTNCEFGIFFFDDTGNSDFRCTDHHDIYVFSGQCIKHH